MTTRAWYRSTSPCPAGATLPWGARQLDALPAAARDYIAMIEAVVGAPIDIISTGPDRSETIILHHPFD
jgi:adenylosuccinate synthase